MVDADAVDGVLLLLPLAPFVVAAGCLSTNRCFTSLVVNGAPVVRVVLPADEADEAELSDVLESVLAERADFGWPDDGAGED